MTTFPKPVSAKDCLQLCHSLIESEVSFWEESQKVMIDENPRLEMIVSLLNQERNKGNFVLRASLLEKEEDFNMHSIYKSYTSIVGTLKSFLEILSNAEIPGSFSGLQEEKDCLEKLRRTLGNKNKEIGQKHNIYRSMIQSSCSGSGQSKAIRGKQEGNFGSDLREQFGKYAYCDTSYIQEVFFPIIEQIFNLTRTTLLERLSKEKGEQGQKGILQRSQRRQKKGKNKGKANPCVKPLESQIPKASEKENVEDQRMFPIPQLDSLEEETKNHKVFQVEEPKIGKEMADFPEVEDISLAVSVPQAGQNSLAELFESQACLAEANLLPIQPCDDLEVYDPVPWEKYKNKNLSLSGDLSNGQDPYSHNAFLLSEESSLTARILLGVGKDTYYENVRMAHYINLIKELGGSAVGKKKSVHFMARSLVNGQWCSVAMHRLHQDDPHIIPSNTRYWKIARQLLLDIGLSEINLKI